MSKNNDKGTTATKAKRAKTPAQLAKKARNEQDHAARLLMLQKEQAALNAIRAEFPNRTLTDECCRALIEERAARKTLDVLLAIDLPVGGEAFGKRLMRFIGTSTLKGVAKGDVAVRDIIGACWRYAATQDAYLRPQDGEYAG
jgi:hypothetical protein